MYIHQLKHIVLVGTYGRFIILNLYWWSTFSRIQVESHLERSVPIPSGHMNPHPPGGLEDQFPHRMTILTTHTAIAEWPTNWVLSEKVPTYSPMFSARFHIRGNVVLLPHILSIFSCSTWQIWWDFFHLFPMKTVTFFQEDGTAVFTAEAGSRSLCSRRGMGDFMGISWNGTAEYCRYVYTNT